MRALLVALALSGCATVPPPPAEPAAPPPPPVFMLEVVSDAGDFVRLAATPCAAEKVLAITPPAMHPALFHASVLLDKVMYQACWAPLGGGQVGLIGEDGSSFQMPLGAFKQIMPL